MTSLTRISDRLARNTNAGDLEARLSNDDRDKIVLLDSSGSMDSTTENNETRKIDAARKIIYDLKEEGFRFRLIVFGGSVEMREDIPEPSGGTPLTEAIELAANHKPSELTVISDGAPDNPSSALLAAKKLGVKIHCFYVGPRPSQGEVFMSQLADATGGSSHVGDLGKGIKALVGEIKAVLMLSDDNSKPIAL